jgi:hypothetical protein
MTADTALADDSAVAADPPDPPEPSGLARILDRERSPSNPAALRAREWRPVRWLAVAGWLLLLAVWIRTRGIPFDRTGLMIWIAAGLLAASIGRRSLWTVIADWLPFALVLIAYDFARGASEHLNGTTLWLPQIRFDTWLFDGHEPTVWLQAQLKDTTVRWWDAGVSLIYTSFFLLPYVVAGILWLQSRREFHRWVARYVTLSFLGVAAFILFPAAPPWAAARCVSAQVSDHPSYPGCLGNDPANVPGGGLLGRFVPTHPGASPYVERISGRGFGELHLTVAKAVLREGQGTVDLVAAIPSLHAGASLLVVLFLWKRWRIYWRVIGVAYVLAMAFALVYSAEHYVLDILIGWAMAGLVMGGFGWFEHWLAGRRLSNAGAARPTRYAGPTQFERSDHQPMENPCPPIETMPSSA